MVEPLTAAVGLISSRSLPRRMLVRTLAGNASGVIEEFEALTREDQDAAAELAQDLYDRRVELLMLTDSRYPPMLRDLASPPPFLFMWGNRALLDEPGIAMCGSRNASDRGLDCARKIGRAVAARGVHVISGYAKGVDTETHLGALESGAGTVIVLAEGILRFRRKRVFADVPFDESNVLVISQFAPHAAWSAGSAMARNSVIVALGSGLLVIEAGERGGTLDAGLQALDLKRPVFAISFSENPPAGNELLIRRGARPLRTSREAAEAVDALLTTTPSVDHQLGLDGSA